MILTSTSDIVRIVTSSTADIHVQAGWADITTTAFTPGRTNTVVTSATTTTIVASPGASTQRQCKTLSIYNAHASTSNTVTIQHYDGTTSVDVYETTLAAGERAQYNGDEWLSNATGAGITDGDKGDITVASSGTVWTIDTPPVATVASTDKVLIKDTDAADVMKYVTAQSIADLAAGGVTSVNTKTGVVVIDPDDLVDTSTTNKFVTATDITNLGNLSGTNTGDQTITLTGGVTGSGTGSFAATVATNANLTGPITSVGNATTIADPELAALAGLTSAADKVPYFTGSGTAALADLSSSMRTFMSTPSSANLASLLTDETGTGANVHATSPTLVTPALGTPTSGDLSNCTEHSAPYFNAYRATSTQAIAAATYTKIQLNAEAIDSSACFDSTTNYRFTPTIAGKYIFGGVVKINSMANETALVTAIYKNGASAAQSVAWSAATGGSNMANPVTTELDMNGSTDYVELYAAQFDSVSRNVQIGADITFFFGHRIS